MRKIAGIGALLVAAGAAAGGWWWTHRRPPADDRLTLYGNIEIRDVQLAFDESERIAAMRVEEGDRVKAGQVLATLVNDRLQAQLAQAKADAQAQEQVLQRLLAGSRPEEIAQARAQVRAAEARVANDERMYERLRSLVLSGATSQQSLDDALSTLNVDRAQLAVEQKALQLALIGPRREDIASARAQLEALRANTALLEIRLRDTVLTSPSDGVIESRILEPGDQASPDRPALLLALNDPKWVRAWVPEPQLGHVRLGLAAEVQSDSFPDQRFRGQVGFISPTAEFTPKNVQTTDLRTRLVYEVRIYVRDPEDRLRLGMPVTVTVLEREAGAAEGVGRNGP
jgi:HlyD family secretion protein